MSDILVIVILICVSAVTCCFRICATIDLRSKAAASAAVVQSYMFKASEPEEEIYNDKHM